MKLADTSFNDKKVQPFSDFGAQIEWAKLLGIATIPQTIVGSVQKLNSMHRICGLY